MPTFLENEKPLLTAMIQCATPEACKQKIKASIEGGADALGIQLCKLEIPYRTPEMIKDIFDACEGKPIYATAYPHGASVGFTDEQNEALLLMALDCGATLLDVRGDMFDTSPYYELTENPEAIRKQKDLIDEIHRRRGEVLMSSHTFKDLSIEENLRIAKAHEERGADVIKIVNRIDNKDSIPVQIASIQKILQRTKKKLLFLVSGEGQVIRYIGPNFGVCMYLCVTEHGEMDTPEQPLLSDLVAIRDHMNFNL
ncbi:MAG: type I 3-dehydroquinate dehydratase [Clostridia bacterium]|nr:type I 3-dehydroquinate dehydratase [Clostridia bacterium]